LFGSLAIAIGVYGYNQYLTNQLADKTATLNQSRENFDVDTLLQVYELDQALKLTEGRLRSNVALVRMFDELDRVTTEPVQITSLSLDRDSGGAYTMSGTIITSSFDAAIQQRDVYALPDNAFQDTGISEVTLNPSAQESENASTVELAFTITTPIEDIRYQADAPLPDSLSGNADLSILNSNDTRFNEEFGEEDDISTSLNNPDI
jgi:hypothetical protein